MKRDRRSGRRESRPGHGCLLPVSSRVDFEKAIARLGKLADICFGEQLEFSYEASLKWQPKYIDEGYSPTAEEITARCKEIRDCWDDQRWRHIDPVLHVELLEFQTRDLIK